MIYTSPDIHFFCHQQLHKNGIRKLFKKELPEASSDTSYFAARVFRSVGENFFRISSSHFDISNTFSYKEFWKAVNERN